MENIETFFICPECIKILSAKRNLYGAKVRCYICYTQFKVNDVFFSYGDAKKWLEEIERKIGLKAKAEARELERLARQEEKRTRQEAKERALKEKKEEYNRKQYPCPECGKNASRLDIDLGKVLIVDGMAYCPKCAPNKPCPYCGEETRPTAIKCRFCGEIIDAEVRAKEKGREKRRYEHSQKQKSSSTWIIAICILVAAVIVIGGLIGYNEYKEYKRKKELERIQKKFKREYERTEKELKDFEKNLDKSFRNWENQFNKKKR
ncbi:MAG: hypothetical protein E3J72_20005 [Planctomycetota bacterium]|nr:MAG: hypothetical protein E3J72_20005 [Planctomycetota bacterium]